MRDGVNTYLTYCGEMHSIAEWAEICGVRARTMMDRRKRGCTPEEILAPLMPRKVKPQKVPANKQPCWTCKKACGRCAWSRKPNPQPIPGWIAEQTELKISKGKKQVSYRIVWCPEWESDGRKEDA